MSKRARPELLADADLPRLYSIDSGRPFLADLADGLINALGHDLARAEIFLPTRRALRAAADAILSAYEARGVNAALLPRFRAIGDIEEDELAAFAGDIADEIDLLPAISPTARLVALARFVAARDRAFAGHENWPAAIAAAREFGRMLDSFYTEEIDFSALKALNVEDAAGHWARALHFLDIVAEIWPQYLRDIGRLDPADRRARLIGATARRFAENPPGHPVLIAGSTASAPAVARLVAAIARAPIGAAILPGLDRTMDVRARNAIDDAHPQSGLKALLRELGVGPEAVRAWPKSGARNPRTHLLTLALRPAEATDEWLSLVTAMTADDAGLAKSAHGLNLVEADNEELEAAIIAALFRETVETPGKTAFLVTPDRRLARRVALKMRRWNIDVDDSAGVPFANTPCGTFLRLLASFMDDPGDPVAILALLRHPFARLRLDDPAAAIDAIDAALRGVRPAQGLARLEARFKERETPHGDALAALALLRQAADLAPRADDAPFAEMFDAHLKAAELVAGEDLLWAGRDGEAGARLLSELRASADDITAIGGRRYADVFSALIAGAAVRRRSAAHPRLAIFGPLEARLQCADRIILGGLNEGVWPQDAASDPFLSRRMRKDLGLPSPERRIGLSAHDFEGLAAQGEVFLTRSKRADGKPANPSRWIVRLKNILTGADALGAVDRTPMLQAIATKLDAAQTVARIDRPRPKAGPGRRPERVSVTQIEKWLRDPYSVYARYLLGLRKIEDPGVAFGARDMGSLLHRIFEDAARKNDAPTPAHLHALYDDLAAEYGLSEADRRFWSAAIDDSFRWFSAFDAAQREKGRLAIAEEEGAWTLPGVSPPFMLTAIADRIDLEANGAAAIIDYKSGKLRTEKQDASFSPQLALTGAILSAGGYAAIGARDVARYHYVKTLHRSAEENKNGWGREGDDARQAVREAEERLRALIAAFDSPDTVYLSQPRPEFSDDYGDYDQLARRKEWGASDDGGDGGEA